MYYKNTLCLLIIVTIMLFSQCKSSHVSISRKAKSTYNFIRITNLSEKTFNKLLTNPKRNQKHFNIKRFNKKLSITKHESSGFSALTICNQTPSNKHIIYFHGGAYFAEATKSHRKLIEKICLTYNYKVSFIKYPLAPENEAAFTHKVTNELYQIIQKKYPDDVFILMGDSAGGGLALAFLQTLVSENHQNIPNKTVLLSPWLDVEMSNPEITDYIEKDVLLNLDGMIKCGQIYAGKLPTKDPQVSPIYGNMNNLGEIKVFVSTHELFYPDCQRLKSKILQAEGSSCDMTVMNNMIHDWIIFPFDESEQCLEEIHQFIEN